MSEIRENELLNYIINAFGYELRDPMNSLGNMLQSIKRSDLSEETQFLLNMADNSLQTCTRTFRKLMNYYHSIHPDSPVSPCLFNPHDLMTTLVTRFKQIAEEKDSVILLDLKGDSAAFSTDVEKLKAILECVLENAIRHTVESRISIQVFLKDTLNITISDNGTGIPENELSSLFTMKIGTEKTYTRNNPGLGIGLPTAGNLTSLLKGEIDITSQSGKGTTVTLDFPRLYSKEGKICRGDKTVVNPSASHSGSILIVEDNYISQYYLEKILLRKGYEITIASNGDEAVDPEILNGVSLIVLDIGLPKRNGMEVIRFLKENDQYSWIPIIVITGYTAPNDLQMYDSLDVVAVFSKPLDEDELLNKIASVYSEKSYQEKSNISVQY